MSDRGYIYYPSFHEALKDLPPEEFKECQLAINNYALFGIESELSPVAKMFFTLVKPQIDANRKRYENGMKGGRPKKETKTEPRQNQEETEAKPKQNQNKTEADTEAIPLKDGSEWKPTIDLYEEYCRLYPSKNIKAEFRNMRAWCLNNPSKRKTKQGIKRFVGNWLSSSFGTQKQVVMSVPHYISQQMEGTLPNETPATQEDIDVIKKLLEGTEW